MVTSEVLHAMRSRGYGPAAVGRRQRGDRFGRVLDDVGERLRASGARRSAPTSGAAGSSIMKAMSGMGDLEQEHRLADRLGQIALDDERRLRHAREDENSSTMRPISPTWRMMVSVHWSKTSRSLVDDAAEFAPQPLRRKLDRGQRVLDLVGDAAGDVGPGGAALGGDEVGDVVEGDDIAVSAARRPLGGDADIDRAVAAAAGDA